MLNGIDPIIIFSFFKKIPTPTESGSKIPIVAGLINKLALPPIPIYLSESLTGLYIDAESKNLDVLTSVETLTSGDDPIFSQKGIGSLITINLVGLRDSTGLTLLLALSDLIFSKVTSREYSITYLHGAVTLFNGLLHTFSLDQDPNTDLYKIKIELSRDGQPKKPVVQPTESTQTAQLNDGGHITGGTLPPAGGGSTAGTAFKSAPIHSVPIRGSTL